MNQLDFHLRPALFDEDRTWLAGLWQREWGGLAMLTRGRLHHIADMEAIIAWEGGARVGAATYRIDGDECELMSLNSLSKSKGVGTHLLAAVETAARERGCRRLSLITTNDNLDALRFYQRRGYRLTAIYSGAVDQARKVKPTIPMVGNHGIPIRDEIELERALT